MIFSVLDEEDKREAADRMSSFDSGTLSPKAEPRDFLERVKLEALHSAVVANREDEEPLTIFGKPSTKAHSTPSLPCTRSNRLFSQLLGCKKSGTTTTT